MATSNNVSGLIYQGKSSADLGIMVQFPADPIYAVPDINATHIPGRSGDFLEDDNSYQNVTKTFNIIVNRPLDITQFDWEREFIDWLASPRIQGKRQYEYLQFDIDPQYAYKAIVTTSPTINWDQQTPNLGTGQITFYCEPFEYRVNGISYIDLPENGTVYNRESMIAVPNWHFLTRGSFVLTVNELSYQFDNLNGEFWLNGDTGDTTDEKGDLFNNQTHFPNLLPPELLPGENNISLTAESGIITKVEYMPRWRRLI
ncbi:phage tail protein [uncultured Lactobacillus sp.]|uniref:phage tail protein n=1 Tax=uncultured Lactobacillus sp. TaxID=153152 RepID=UPI0025D3CD2E|nr:phage tail protein [uncultured Lactobacillus sp.]